MHLRGKTFDFPMFRQLLIPQNTLYTHTLSCTLKHARNDLLEPGTTSVTISSEDNESLIKHNLHNMLWLRKHSNYYVFNLKNTAFGHICVHNMLPIALKTGYITKAGYGLYMETKGRTHPLLLAQTSTDKYANTNIFHFKS